MNPTCTFGVFADLHYARRDPLHGRHYRDSLEKLEACINVFNRRGLRLVINLGDLIDAGPTLEDELDALYELRQAMRQIAGERQHVLGNHDVYSLTKAQFLNGLAGEMPAPAYGFDFDGWRFLVLDGNCHMDGSDFAAGAFDWDNAWISPQQLNWLEDELQLGDSPVIVLCHECLDNRQHEGEPYPYVVRNAAETRSILEASPRVKAVFSGHDHRGYHTVINRIPYVTLQGMVKGPGLLNNAFAEVMVDDLGVTVSGHGNQRSFRLER